MEDRITYLRMLNDILVQKERIIKALAVLTGEQNRILTAEEVDLDAFDAILPKKAALISQLEQLDKGFSDTYAKVQGILAQEKETYRDIITELQDRIRKLTEDGVRLQTLEQQNKLKMELYLTGKRRVIKEYKVNSKTASMYYKNMAGTPQGESYFMDKRK